MAETTQNTRSYMRIAARARAIARDGSGFENAENARRHGVLLDVSARPALLEIKTQSAYGSHRQAEKADE